MVLECTILPARFRLRPDHQKIDAERTARVLHVLDCLGVSELVVEVHGEGIESVYCFCQEEDVAAVATPAERNEAVVTGGPGAPKRKELLERSLAEESSGSIALTHGAYAAMIER